MNKIEIVESQYWRTIKNNDGNPLKREKKNWSEQARNGRIENNQVLYDIYDGEEFKRTKKFYLPKK